MTLWVVRKENGSAVSSPGCTSILEKSMLRRLTRGGVPVLKRRRCSPRARKLSASPTLGCIPSGPEGMTLWPVMTVLSKYVPVAITTAFAPYSAPSWVRTPVTAPSAVRISTICACFSSRFSCNSSVCFIYCRYFTRSAWARREWTAGPLPRLSIRYWMQAWSAAAPISPPSASSSRTRCPFPVPPMAGLQGIFPTASRLMVKRMV